MPRTISSFGTLDKNRLATSTVWLTALEIVIPGGGTVRIIDNNESVSWRGETWVAFPFKFDPIGEESKGEVPRVELRVSNVNRTMEAYIQAYDLYTKINGFSPIEVSIYVVNNQGVSTGVLTDSTLEGAVTESGTEGATTDELYEVVNPDPEAVFVYELQSIRTDSTWATFTLGAANPYNKRYPMHRLLKNHCRFHYNYPVGRGVLCGAPGSAYATCGKTLTDCRARNNSERFGGFPGVGLGGLRLA